MAVAADSTLIEPNHPRLVRMEVTLPRLTPDLDGLTIAQLSDFHFDPFFSVWPTEAAVRITNEANPDLVVLTGDFVSRPIVKGRGLATYLAAHMDPCSHMLTRLRSRLGIWAVLGNHDVLSGSGYVESSLRQAGIHVLRNQGVPIEHKGSRFWLVGVDDVLMKRDDLDGALRSLPASDVVILLAHEPDFADTAARYPIDLQLSGHSHGGQVRFPFVGPIYLPPLGQKYPWGLRQIGRLTLYTNPGIGTLLVPVRWNCPPEVTLVTLRSLGRRTDW